MSDDAEWIAKRDARVRDAISKVRGHARTSTGAVVVETDMDGTITELRISPTAMTADPQQLASAITQCHGIARERAQAEVTEIFREMMDSPRPPISEPLPESRATAGAPEWEEATPLRITHSL